MTTRPAAKTVRASDNMNTAAVNQHKRLAMGLPVDGKTLPGTRAAAGTPAQGRRTPA